jgi:hypothetical protein
LEAALFTRQRISIYPTTHLVGSISVAMEPLEKVFTIAFSKYLLKGERVSEREEPESESQPEKSPQRTLTSQCSESNQLEKSPDTVSYLAVCYGNLVMVVTQCSYKDKSLTQ